MAITTTCTGCRAIFRLPDEMSGKSVRCQKCERMFVVPMSVTGTLPAESEIAPPAEEPIAKDDAATPVQESPPVESAPVQEAPIEAKIAEPMLVVPVKADSPQTPDVPPAPAREAPKPPPEPSRWRPFLAPMALALSVILIGGFAVAWVYAHLGPTPRVVLVPPLRDSQGRRDRLDRDGFMDRKDFDKDRFGEKRQTIEPTQLFLDFNGLTKQDRTASLPHWQDPGRFGNDGPFRLYRLRLEQGICYNFFVSSTRGVPRLRIFDDQFAALDRFGIAPVNKLFASYQPDRTHDFLIFVTLEFNEADFTLQVAAESTQPPRRLQVQPPAPLFETLSVRDRLDLNAQSNGPYHEYLVDLESGQEYSIKVDNTEFQSVVQFYSGGFLDREFVAVDRRLDHTYRAPRTGEYRVRFTSRNYGEGPYTFTIAKRVAPKVVSRTLAFLNEGKYEHSGIMTDKDALDPTAFGRGPYKEYNLTLERGITYRIEMKSQAFATTLRLFDADGRVVANTAVNPAVIVYTPNLTGGYRLHAGAMNPSNRGAYSLKIEAQP